jgi:hypothetical protein
MRPGRIARSACRAAPTGSIGDRSIAMELELYFDGLVDDVTDAVADVQVEDLGMADAPVDGGPAVRIGPFRVVADRPSVTASVDLPSTADAYEPGLLVRVRARTADDRPVEFLNTTATRLPRDGVEPVRVVLSRIT